MIILLLLSFSPLSSAVLTMITIWGAPDDTSFFFDKSQLPWEECVSTCLSTKNCMIASNDATDSCVTYNYGDVYKVKIGDSSGGNKVSIKIDMDSEECLESPTDIFSVDKTYKALVSSMWFGTYKIEVSAEFYTFKYLDESISSACNEMLEAKPQCDSKCKKGVFPVSGYSYGVFAYTENTIAVVSWRECMAECFRGHDCAMVEMGKASTECKMYLAGRTRFIMKSDKAEGLKVAFKLKYGKVTCGLTTEEALNGHAYVVEGDDGDSVYQIRTSSIAYGMYWATKGCDQNDIVAGDCSAINLFTTKINYETAKGLCEAIGDGLQPLKNKAMSDALVSQTNSFKMRYYQYGRQDAVTYVGLTRKASCVGDCSLNLNWEWSLPDLVTDDTGFTWATGFPSPDTTQKCAVSNVPTNPYNPPADPNKHFLESTDCSTLADGFFCHIPILKPD